MNIFFLDKDPKLAAQYHCDKHVVKMILESAQLLSTAWYIHCPQSSAERNLYKPTHANHPCSLWTRKTQGNYKWLWELAAALCQEYTYRYGKIHASQQMIEKLVWCPRAIIPFGLLDPVQCMPDEYKQADGVQAYRNYYINDKAAILSYKKREVPEWLPLLKVAA